MWGSLDEVLHHKYGHGGTADVAVANHEHFYLVWHKISFPFKASQTIDFTGFVGFLLFYQLVISSHKNASFLGSVV